MSLLDELKEQRSQAVSALEMQQAYVVAHQSNVDDWHVRIADIDRAIAALEPAPTPEPETQTGEGVEIPEGFTKWEGGECPVDPAALVCVVTRSGKLEQFHAGTFANPDVLFDQWQWSNYRRDDDIIAYRVSLAAPTPEDEPDDASEFAEELERAAAIELTADVEPVPEPYRITADVDDKPLTIDFATLHEATECLEELSLRSASRAELQVLHEGENGEQAWVSHIVREFPASEPLPQPEWNEPQTEGYAPVTNPEAHIQAVEAERYAQPTNPEADALAKAHDWYDPKAVHDRNKFNPWGIFGSANKRETEEVS
jgi:hypothetical protein